MDANSIRSSLNNALSAKLDICERRPGSYQLIVPILHEDGDMVDIYLQDSPDRAGHIRISDFGMTLMRLSYTYDVNTSAREKIFDSILINNGVSNSEGNLYLDVPTELLCESILRFAGCAQKVCNMRYWSRETVRSAFYDDLSEYVTTGLTTFDPTPNYAPISNYPISVDWRLEHHNRPFFVFGVLGNDKAKNVAIALLEFQKVPLSFISLVVHENFDELGARERLYLTRNADTQYPILNDFLEKAPADIGRLASVSS